MSDDGFLDLLRESPAEAALREQREACEPARYGRLAATKLSQVRSRSVKFVVPGLIPLRTITLLAGVGGLGKSTYAAGVAAHETRGEYDNGTPHQVVIVSYEDTAEEVWRPRVLAANGDPDRVLYISVSLDDGGVVVLPEDLDALEELIRDLDARLVIVDPLVAALNTTYDAFKDQHVRSILGKLTKVAEDTGSAVVGIGHLNKQPSAEAYIRIANSVAFWNAARSVVLVTKEDDEHRLVSQVKANWTRSGGVHRYRIQEVVLPDEIDRASGYPIVTSTLVYLGEADDVDADSVLSKTSADGEDGKLMAGVRYLVAELADGGWHESATLKANAGMVSERTLERAAKELEVEHERHGFPAVTRWRLPQSRHTLTQNGGATSEPAWIKESRSLEVQSRQTSSGTGDGTTGRLLPGDSGYLEQLWLAFENGHVTETEWRQLERAHRSLS